MKRVSLWGKNNPQKAILILTLCHISGLFVSLFSGFLSYCYDIPIPREATLLVGFIFFTTFALYPRKTKATYSYAWQKVCDFALVSSAILVIMFGFNQFAFEKSPSEKPIEAKAQFIVLKNTPSEKQEKTSLFSPIKNQVKKVKKSIKERLRTWKKNFKTPKRNRGDIIEKFLLNLLNLGLLVLLVFLVVALSCNLSCSGYPGLALAVLIIGLGGSIFLCFIIGRAIYRKFRKRK